MKPDNTLELMEMLFKISRAMKEKMSFKSNLTHLSVVQIQTLFFLDSRQKVTMSDLAQHFLIELPSATSLINKLCDQDLVKRYEDKQDRRLVMVTLTQAGKSLLQLALQERKKKLEKLLSYLSTKEKQDLLSIFKTLANRLQKENEK